MICGKIKGKRISMRASKRYQYSPYRRTIQKMMKRIAPIVPFVKGKIMIIYSMKAQWYNSISYIHTSYIYIYVCIYKLHTLFLGLCFYCSYFVLFRVLVAHFYYIYICVCICICICKCICIHMYACKHICM